MSKRTDSEILADVRAEYEAWLGNNPGNRMIHEWIVERLHPLLFGEKTPSELGDLKEWAEG